MRKTIPSVVLCLLLALLLTAVGTVPAQAAGREILADGKCGENATWTLDNYGCVAISGTGAMDDYESFIAETPWSQYSYDNDVDILSVSVNEGITHVGANAFRQLKSLTSVYMEESVTSIGEGAFEECIALTDIAIPSQVTVLERFIFARCTALESVILPEGMTQIKRSAFDGCTALTDIALPGELLQIDAYAFSNSALTELVIPDKVQQIQQEGFSRCESLETVHIGKSLGMLTSDDAFAFCSALTGFTVDEENTYFETDSYGALYGDYRRILYQFPCASPVKYYWPDAETREISSSAFAKCVNLKGIYLPENCLQINYFAFRDCTALEEIFLREGTYLDDMSSSWFMGCSSLKYIYLPNSITEICSSTFEGCESLGSITIPAAVTQLNQNAFYNCENLKSITFLGNAPTVVDSTVFEGCPSDMVIFYKEGTSGWSNPWNGFPTAAIPAEQAYAQPDVTDYVNHSSRRSFKIRDFSDKNYVSQDFCVTAEDQNFYSEHKGLGKGSSCLIYTDVDPIDSDILIEHKDYHSYTMPASLVANYNTVTMTKKTVTEPFPQALLVDNSSRNFKTLINVFEKTASSTEPGIDGTPTPLRLYVDINWNGHGEGIVWLQQGFTTIALEDDRYNYINMGEEFAVGGSIYLCTQAADGITTKHLTRLSVVRNSTNNLPIDTGDTTDADTTQAKDDTTKLFGKTNMELNLKILEDNVPLTFITGSDGSFEVIVGVKMAKDKDERVALGNLKESINALSKAGTVAEQQRETAKMLDKISGFGKPHQNFGKTAVEANVQVVGYLNGRTINGERRITGGKIALMVKGEGSYTFQTYVPVVVATIPAYFKVAVEATLATYVGLQYDDDGNFITPERLDPLDGTFQVSAAAGPGWEGYLSIGIEGAGTLGLHTTFPIKQEKTSLTVQSSLKGVGTLLGMEIKFDLVPSTPEYIFWKAGDFCWEEYTCPYSLRTSARTYLVDTARSTMVQDFSDDGVIASGISGYSAPSLTRLSNGLLMALWAADDPTRGSLDKNALYYSIRSEDGTWSEARQVWADGTLDSDGKLFTHRGETWAIWSNYTQTFGQSTPDYDTLAAQIDIAVARFDPDSGEFTDARNLHMPGYDATPRLLNYNGNLAAAWTNDDQVCTFLYLDEWIDLGYGAADSDYHAQTSLPEDYPGQWPAMAASPLVVEGDGGLAVLYVAADSTGVNNLFGIFRDNSSWGQPVQLTFLPAGHSIGGFSAELLGSRLNILLIHRELDMQYNITDASIQLLELDRSPDLSIDDADYDPWSLVPGGALALELDVTNYGTWPVNGLSLQIFQGGSPVSTQQLGAQIMPGETKTVLASCPLPDTADPELTLQILPMDGTDRDDSNNTTLLTLRPADVSVDQVTADHDGTGAVVTAFLSNPGQQDLQDITVVFRKGSDDGEILEEAVLESLPAGEMAAVTMTDTTALENYDLVYAEAVTGLEENLMGNNVSFGLYAQPEEEDPDFIPTPPGQEIAPPTEPEETTPPEPTETTPPETTPPETNPPETNPPETDPPETAPTETTPSETTPSVPTEPTEPPHVHSFGPWIVIQDPSGTTEGTEQRICSCGHTETRSIPVLENPFTDVKNTAYYYDPVLWAVDKGITNGITPTTFVPGGECTRAQFVTFLWRASGCPEPESLACTFTDLRKDAYYETAVLWAVEAGITNGLSPNQFGPGETCTRGQVVTFLHRWQGSPTPTSQSHCFTDVQQGKFYYNSVLWAVENGITNGMTPDTFAPGSPCTRAQVVTFLYRSMTQ